MLNLQDFPKLIETNTIEVINAFTHENGDFNSLGIYCCPWSGWISYSFNKIRLLEETEFNCPDFEYVEFKFMNIPKWLEIYENNGQIKLINDSVVEVSKLNGDDEFNKIFFDFLIDLVSNSERFKKYRGKIFIQMLDSAYSKIL